MPQIATPEDFTRAAAPAPLPSESGLPDAAIAGVTALLALLRHHHAPSWRHSLRVSAVARELAVSYGLGRADAATVGAAARLHDIGKVRIPARLLSKPAVLSGPEMRDMRTHPEWGLFLVRSHIGSAFEAAARVTLSHHERWDSGGYPRGLARRQVPFEARITAVADAYDALRSPREYKPARPHEEAMHRIQSGAGSQFDPEVVEALTASQSAVERRWEAVYADMPESDIIPGTDLAPL